ncbi:MAG: RimK/LysX family protein [Gammaproteobacteria bacterium]
MPKRAVSGAVLLTAGLVIGWMGGTWSAARTLLPPVTQVVVAEAGMAFDARLDTGATVSSIHAEDIVVAGGRTSPGRDDVGRTVHFVLVNAAGERRALQAPIALVRGIRMADCREVRYHVWLTIVHRGRALRVLANLNDRSGAADKLLLGRNWLRHGYAVAAPEEAEI